MSFALSSGREILDPTTNGVIPRLRSPSIKFEYHWIPGSFTGSLRPPSGIILDQAREKLSEDCERYTSFGL